MGPPPLESELCSVGSVWSLPLPAHRQTHSLTLTHRHTHTHTHTQTHTHTHSHAHGQTYAHETHGHTHTDTHAHKLTHSDTHITRMHMQYAYTHILVQTRHHTHTCTSVHTDRHACTDTRVHRQTQMHTRHTHICTITCTGAICTWVESSGRRKAEEWGLGKRDLRVSVGGVAPAPRSWNQGGAAAMGEEVDLGGGQMARAA